MLNANFISPTLIWNSLNTAALYVQSTAVRSDAALIKYVTYRLFDREGVDITLVLRKNGRVVCVVWCSV